MQNTKKGLSNSNPNVQKLFTPVWNPSPQLIQGVVNSLGVSKKTAMNMLQKVAQQTAFMKIDLNQIPEKTLLSMIMMTKNVVAGKKNKSINNKQGLA